MSECLELDISYSKSFIYRFIVAGHETTSTATMWCLYQLTQSPDVQRKLRDELLTVETDTPSMDQLNALPYLDTVLKETLRHHAPVTATTRIAVRDEMIPVGKAFTDKRGRICDHIKYTSSPSAFIHLLTRRLQGPKRRYSIHSHHCYESLEGLVG